MIFSVDTQQHFVQASGSKRYGWNVTNALMYGVLLCVANLSLVSLVANAKGYEWFCFDFCSSSFERPKEVRASSSVQSLPVQFSKTFPHPTRTWFVQALAHLCLSHSV